MDFFPHLTSVLAALATSATIASLLQQPVGFKKKNLTLSSCSSCPSIYFGWLLIITGSILMCMLHHGVAAGLLKSISPTTQELEDVDLRVLPSCVSRKQHVVYKTSNVNVVLFTSWFLFSFFFSIPGREICSSGFVTSSSINRLLVWFRVCVYLSCFHCACVRIGVGEGMVSASWFAGSHSIKLVSPPPDLPSPRLLSDKNDFDLCFYLLSPPVTYLVLK